MLASIAPEGHLTPSWPHLAQRLFVQRRGPEFSKSSLARRRCSCGQPSCPSLGPSGSTSFLLGSVGPQGRIMRHPLPCMFTPSALPSHGGSQPCPGMVYGTRPVGARTRASRHSLPRRHQGAALSERVVVACTVEPRIGCCTVPSESASTMLWTARSSSAPFGAEGFRLSKSPLCSIPPRAALGLAPSLRRPTSRRSAPAAASSSSCPSSLEVGAAGGWLAS